MAAAPRANGGAAQQSDGSSTRTSTSSTSSRRRKPISSNPEVTGQPDPPSSRYPRWKSSWAGIRAFYSKHPKLSALLGAGITGLIAGISKVFGENFAESTLSWLSQL